MKFPILGIVLLVGCIDDGSPDPALPESCGASELAGIVGQSKSSLAPLKFSGPVRILGENQPMTMDYNPSRLNIITDDAGIITRVWCG